MSVEHISPFSSMVENNDIPSEDEITAIQQYLISPLSEATALDEEIAQMQTALKAVQERREALSLTIGTHKALISPLRRYPDILQEIFHHCLPTAHDAKMNSLEAPLVLTHVCRSWRNLAHSTPSLWSSIFICVPDSYQVDYILHEDELDQQEAEKAQVELKLVGVGEWLSRSGACPLSISFVENSDGFVESLCGAFLDAIRPFASRWKRLVLRLNGQAPSLNHFTSILSQEVRNLEELVLDVASYNDPTSFAPDLGRDGWRRSGLIQAPKLKRVAFTHIDENVAAFQLPWSQLTHFSFELNRQRHVKSLSASEIIEILRQCPNLVSIQVEIGRIEEELVDAGGDINQIRPAPVWSHEQVIMHHLLYLSIHTAVDLSQIFPLIQAPLLREFSFFGMPFPCFGVPSLLSFLSCVPTIRRLSIDPRCFTPKHLSQCLASCSMITSLRFCMGFVNDGWYRTTYSRGGSAQFDHAMLALITPTEEEDGGEYLCRYLREFQSSTSSAGFTAKMVYDFVVARQRQARNGYPKLNVVSVRFLDNKNMDLLDTLRDGDEDDFELTTIHPTPVNPRVYAARRYMEAVARYPLYSTTAESEEFDQLDVRMFSVPKS